MYTSLSFHLLPAYPLPPADLLLSHFLQVRDLRANWETKPPISAKPEPSERRSRREGEEERRSRGEGGEEEMRVGVSLATKGRKDSDSSSRGRMGRWVALLVLCEV